LPNDDNEKSFIKRTRGDGTNDVIGGSFNGRHVVSRFRRVALRSFQSHVVVAALDGVQVARRVVDGVVSVKRPRGGGTTFVSLEVQN